MPRFHTSRVKRGLATLAMLFACYWLYALVAVPLIEPAVALQALATSTAADAEAAKARFAKKRDDLKAWFGKRDWELTSSMVLETERTKLLFQSYENGRDGTLKLRPCTVIMLGSQAGKSLDQWQREAVILQAPDGADLKFDAPLNIGTGRMGNLQAGQLIGRFTIRSDQKAPGPDDDLLIVGTDASLRDNRITSQHPLEFRLGSSFGSGRELRIDLLPGDGARGAAFNGIASMEIKREVQMQIEVDQSTHGGKQDAGGQQVGSKSTPAGGALGLAGNGPQPPLRITSKGPFRFDMSKYVATFHDQVDVLRLRAKGQSDHLQGELLSLFFAPLPGSGSGGFPKLQAHHIEVRGLPVTMHSTADDMDARGEILTYEFETRRISLEGRQPASVRRGNNRIEAPKLIYEDPGPSARSRLGRFWAIGPGKLDAASPENTQQHYRARWSKQARVGPDQQQHLVALTGDSWFQESTTGSLAGDEVYVWLDEQPGDPPATPQAGNPANSTLVPNRMLAQGKVHLESPQIHCNVEKLQVWFVAAAARTQPRMEELPPPAPVQQVLGPRPASSSPLTSVAYRPPFDGAGAQPVRYQQVPDAMRTRPPAAPTQRMASTGPAGMQAETNRPNQPQSRYFVQGNLLQVQLRLTGARMQPELSQLRVMEKVRVIESALGQPEAAPLVLTGDQVDYAQTNNLDGKLAVSGQPAHVEGRGMTLEGPVIRLNRATSELDVDGAGSMILPANRDVQGQAMERPQPVHVHWQRLMHFDGRVAHLEDGVIAQLDGQTLHTHAMEVGFSKPINFANPPRREQPDVAEIACFGEVTFDRPLVERGKLVSVDRMQASTLKVNRITGGVTAEGPGSMTTVRQGAIEMGPPNKQTQQVSHQPGQRLTYLRVEFLTLATGNLNYRTMEFGNRVKTVFGPVNSWDGVVSEVDFDRLGASGRPVVAECGYMESQQLLVSQVKDAEGRDTVALDASGNARLEGINFQDQSFVARGDHIKYEQAKDLVILEGDGRVDAELQRQERVGMKPEYTSSRKIDFWVPRNGRPARVQADGARHVDLVNGPRPLAAAPQAANQAPPQGPPRAPLAPAPQTPGMQAGGALNPAAQAAQPRGTTFDPSTGYDESGLAPSATGNYPGFGAD